MTRKGSRKIHTLRVVVLICGILAVLIALAALAQTRRVGQTSVQTPAERPLREIGTLSPASGRQPTPGVSAERRLSPSELRRNRLAVEASGTHAPLFLPGATYAIPGFYANSVAAADFNGDGTIDLAVGSDCSSNACGHGAVTILMGGGKGTFGITEWHHSFGNGATWIAVADIFADGSPDLVVANSCLYDPRTCPSGAVTTLRNRTDGSFESGKSYASGALFAESVAVADVNGDGILDLVVSNCTNSNACPNSGIGIIGLLLGNGDGTFQPVVTFPSGGVGAGSITLVDVNGDGKPDIEVSNACGNPPSCTSGSVAVLLGNGDGTFQTPINYGSGGHGASSAAVADVNGDGHPDLLVTIPRDDEVGVLLGNGDGTFQTAITYGTGGGAPNFVAVADIDLDGKPDLVVSHGHSTVGVLLGNGDGTFQTALSYSSLGADATQLAVADVNGDGRPDVIVTNLCENDHSNCNHGSVAILLNNTGPHSPTTTALAVNVDPAEIHQKVFYTATVTNSSGGPITGTVTFKTSDNGPTSSAPLVNGKAAIEASYAKAGSHPVTASYSGDTANENSTSTTLTEYVGPAPTTSILTTSGSPSLAGQPVTFTATVTWTYGTVPDGELVTFHDGAIAIGTGTTANGEATFTTSQLLAIKHHIKATYSGDATFKPSTGAVTQVVNGYPTTTTLTSSRNPSHFGKAVTFAAQITGTGPNPPIGRVKFFDGTIAVGAALLNGAGVAKFTTSKLAVGTHPITAEYLGDTASANSTSPVVNQVVQ